MQIVIDIPKVMFINAKKDLLFGADILVNAIKNGTPYETVTEFADRCRECGREKVLDKIKAEIFNACSDNYHMPVYNLSCEQIFEIIDKYKAESEVENYVSN